MSTPSKLQTLAVDDRILFVDDDRRLLDGIRRRMRRRFAIETAVGAQPALDILGDDPSFAVVVADMNMPGMNGATFLGRVKELCPDSVRMMLTGNVDLGTAIAAVNDGSVFRFMTKPISHEDLERFLTAGIEQHRLVNAMQRVAAAEEASRAKSDFLATVSHELRTPLTVIRSSVEILEQFAADEPAEVRAGFVATIGRSANHLETMIDQLLLMAELDKHDLAELQPEDLDLDVVLRAAIERIEEAVPPSGSGPRLMMESVPTRCRGEAAALERALVQLLVNACNVSPAGAPVEVVVASSPAEATVDIIDSGAGVPDSIADRLFEPFVQCADVLTDKPPGLGLGLTIARRILQRHGGGVSFHRDASDRTHFTVTLPRGDGPGEVT